MYFVYLIECKDKSIYTGITTDVDRRFNEHKNKIGGHYTSSKKVVQWCILNSTGPFLGFKESGHGRQKQRTIQSGRPKV